MHDSTLLPSRAARPGYPVQRRRIERVTVIVLAAATVMLLSALAAVVWHVLSRGVPVVTLDFLIQQPTMSGRSGGIFSTIVSTFWVTGLALVISVPVGVGAAVYLTQYAVEGGFVRVIRIGTSSLAAVPSIVYGLFGFLFFVVYLRMGWSVMSGGLTLALMTLPAILKTSEEAIKAVPREYLEGSLALGAPKWKAVFSVVIPAAMPGIMSGILLSIGRSFGETAAVILTAGSAIHMPESLWDPARTMAVHLYILSSEGLSPSRAYGTAAVLVGCVLVLNVAASMLTRRSRLH